MIKVDSFAALDEAIARLRIMIACQWRDEKQPIELLFRKWSDTRTRSQNALYRVWCRFIGDTTGRDEDDVHDLLRYKFLGNEPVNIAGETIWRLRSTTKLEKPEMSEYMLQIEVWATELGIQLPMPADNEYMKYREAAT